ncbi:hypothetical protein, partial [uncultured Sutterella sp.]|uniref:hypothetical protein n=1 Tax=uncultured Sutterella sp. TaxID=286133 RepID=UPI0025DAFA22
TVVWEDGMGINPMPPTRFCRVQRRTFSGLWGVLAVQFLAYGLLHIPEARGGPRTERGTAVLSKKKTNGRTP